MEPSKILDSIVGKFKDILGENLVGIYLHGSLAMGCYTNKSDIDIIVLIRKALDTASKKSIIKSIMDLNDLPRKGIEMSIVLERYAKEFIYPTPFELHYSDYHRERYLSDSKYLCHNSTDKDLAAHFTIIIHRGICLYGREIKEAFGSVPGEYYMDSIFYDIENAREDIIGNPVYITLNLCRVLYYIKENAICSKLEAGNWAREVISDKYRGVVEDAVRAYKGNLDKMEYSKDILVEYAEYMLEKIKIYK